jgi:hypothetical protein
VQLTIVMGVVREYEVAVTRSLTSTPVARHQSGIDRGGCWHSLDESCAESYEAQRGELGRADHTLKSEVCFVDAD